MIALLLRDLRTWRFWRHLTTYLSSAVGFASAIVGIWAAFNSAFVSDHAPAFLIVLGAFAIVYGFYRAWPRPIEQSYASPNTRIRVIEGDIFDQGATNLVIGTCDTFDTEPPNIIDRNSVQAQFLERVYGGDRARLDAELDVALAGVTPRGSIAKPGKTVQYPVGTVAMLRQGPTKHFWLAYAEMNALNNSHGTVNGLWKSLDELWRAVGMYANTAPLATPVFGGKNARMSAFLPAQDSIRFIVLSFMLASRTTPVCEALDVVVHPTVFRGLDRLELQSFLRSLRSS